MDRILTAPEPMIRAILVALCDDKDLQRRALDHLDGLERLDTTVRPRNISLRRKAGPEPAWQFSICMQCRQAFSQATNSSQACRYHGGELSVDEDGAYWADWREQTHGRRDTPGNRESFPEGFQWSCCEKDGTSKGCTRRWHEAVSEANQSSSKRLRTDGDDDGRSNKFWIEKGRDMRPNEFRNEALFQKKSDNIEAEDSNAGEEGQSSARTLVKSDFNCEEEEPSQQTMKGPAKSGLRLQNSIAP